MVHQEKTLQAQRLLDELDIDCWLIFARETGDRPDPGIELVVGAQVTWNAVFLLTRSGERLAICGRYDAEAVRQAGVFTKVTPYDEDLREPLIAALSRIDPRKIVLNFHQHDHKADGLTYGMYLRLREVLGGTPYLNRLDSAGELLIRLRARKTAAEVDRIRAAVATTEEIVALLGRQIVPGVSEAALAEFAHAEFERRSLDSSWDWSYCPIVNTGPNSPLGHVRPQQAITVAPGHLIHIDIGVRQDEYCSDLQRMWYLRAPGEQEAPPTIRHAMDTVVAAIDAGAAALRSGVPGWEVDAAARAVIVAAGYPEYKHALGHGLGRACHDGGPLLGPRWPRYGDAPLRPIEAGHVYTLELGVPTPAGYLAIEEDVLVTPDGCEFLSSFQRELMLL